MRLASLLAVILLTACGGADAPAPRAPVITVDGALRELMHGGPTDGRVALADVVTPTTIAIGALDGLRGEVTVLDGQVHASRVEDGAVVAADARAARAALLVRAEVPAWRGIQVNSPIAARDFDRAIAALLAREGITGATPFVLEGTFSELRAHVVDGPHSHGAPSGIAFDQPGPAVLVGFFSTEHEGVFTHMGATTHLHVLTALGTAHVDHVALDTGATLRVPR